jgi:hypothetical protein
MRKASVTAASRRSDNVSRLVEYRNADERGERDSATS